MGAGKWTQVVWKGSQHLTCPTISPAPFVHFWDRDSLSSSGWTLTGNLANTGIKGMHQLYLTYAFNEVVICVKDQIVSIADLTHQNE